MYRILSVSLVLCLALVSLVSAHQAACHRQHSCPADPEAYVCGDLGHCTACPDNQYCLNHQPRRPAATQQQATRPAPTPASKATPAKVATADKSQAQPAPRQPAKVATTDKSQAQPAPRQPAKVATAPGQEQSSREPADDTQRQWDAYEQQLQAYCTQVTPTAIRQCMHSELARQDTEQARQRAKKYTPPRASR